MTLFLIRWIYAPHLVCGAARADSPRAHEARRARTGAPGRRRVTRDFLTRVVVLASELLLNVDLVLIAGICCVAFIHEVRG